LRICLLSIFAGACANALRKTTGLGRVAHEGKQTFMRHCDVCKQERPDLDFAVYRCNKAGTRRYYHRMCRACGNTVCKERQALREKHPPPPIGTGCNCCGKIDKLFIDHDHATGAWRGWLCRSCNTGIGMLPGDCEEGILQALSYLQRASDGGSV
jgi:hypothetical protein